MTGNTLTDSTHGVTLTPAAVDKAKGDAVVEFDGVQVVVDKKSAPYLEGAEIDYEDTIQASGFQINNPNAQSTCACGDSFN